MATTTLHEFACFEHCICTCLHPQLLSRVWLFATPQTVTHQASLCMEFSRQEYWSGFPFPTPGDLPNPGTEPMSLASPVLAGGFFTTSTKRVRHKLMAEHASLSGNH